MHIQTSHIDFEHANVEQLLASLTAPSSLSEMHHGYLPMQVAAILK